MENTHYIISDAAKMLHVEPHVLRYWEEELSLIIPRNKMGHRLYGKKELHLFSQIMNWKAEGLSLLDIKEKCAGIQQSSNSIIPYPVNTTTVPEQEDKLEQFRHILNRIVSEAIEQSSHSLTHDIVHGVSTQVNKELDYLIREKEDSDEKRFRQLDETIRSYQKARQEIAASQEEEHKKRKRKRFKKQ